MWESGGAGAGGRYEDVNVIVISFCGPFFGGGVTCYISKCFEKKKKL